MFSVDNFKVYFKHNTEGDSRYTDCIIKDETTGIEYSDSAFCHKGDQFKKSTGRKLALARALTVLNSSSVEQPVREEFWKAYFTKMGCKK